MLTEIIVAGLATCEVVEVWRHGEILASWRARAETWGDFLRGLLGCGFCLSPWVAWLLVLPPLLLAPAAAEWHWSLHAPVLLWFFLVLGLAVARLANLVNDLGHAWCRTPRGNRLPDTPDPNGPDPEMMKHYWGRPLVPPAGTEPFDMDEYAKNREERYAETWGQILKDKQDDSDELREPGPDGPEKAAL